jgi:hypothetical protein
MRDLNAGEREEIRENCRILKADYSRDGLWGRWRYIYIARERKRELRSCR